MNGPNDRMTALGVYAGPAGIAAARDFATTMGRPVTRILDFLPGAEGGDATNLAGAAPWLISLHAAAGTKHLELSVPLLPKGDAARGMTLADVANGSLDETWRAVGKACAAAPGLPNDVRLGWEPGNRLYPWCAYDAGAYVAAWQRAATIIRLTPGTGHVRLVWSVAVGTSAALPDPFSAYPGDQHVYAVSVSAHDYGWSYTQPPGPTKTVRDQNWFRLRDGSCGLNYWADFAEAHGKPFGVSEWSVGSRTDGYGGGDNPDYVHRILDWTLTRRPAWVTYFNADGLGATHALTGATKFPESAAAFRARMSAWTAS